MIIFGGRHLQRSLSNIYSLDFSSLTWTKMEPIGSIPLGRDSHTAVLFNNSLMIIFGGNVNLIIYGILILLNINGQK